MEKTVIIDVGNGRVPVEGDRVYIDYDEPIKGRNFNSIELWLKDREDTTKDYKHLFILENNTFEVAK